MKINLNLRTKLWITLSLLVLISGLLLWQHFHGGIVSHYLLHNEDLPKISNLWSLPSIPILTWIVLSLIQKRKDKAEVERAINSLEIYACIGAFLFGIVLTILFYKQADLANSLFSLTFVLALFIPIYKPEYYLGYIWSMTYGFGGVISILSGLVLMAIYAVEYCLIRRAFLFVLGKMKAK